MGGAQVRLLSQLRRRKEWRTSTDSLHSDSLVYDLRGKIIDNTIVGDATSYSGLGYVLQANNTIAAENETWHRDALGTAIYSLSYGTTNLPSVYHYLANSERLDFAYHQQSPYADTTRYTQGTDGAITVDQHIHPFMSGMTWYMEHKTTSSTYSSDRKLLQTNFVLDTTPSPSNPNYKVYHRTETYRYDALNRRVWTQVTRDTALNNCHDHDLSSGCRQEVTRTVWDGNQVLYELRATADTSTNTGETDIANGAFVGRVGYTNAPGSAPDQPLDLIKGTSDLVVLYADWRGRFDEGTCPASLCSASYYFPGSSENLFQDQPLTPTGPPSWYGNVIGEQHDASGYQYKRNRYYDPVTGRFTQEDPIGLAGGINLYGFAKGDPANFDDPFGLRPCPPDNDCDLTAQQSQAVFAILAGMHIDDAILASAKLAVSDVALGVAADGLSALVGSLEIGAARGIGTSAALGRAGESAAGIVKNTKRIESATGTAAYRIPDALGGGVLTEVKNVARLGLTNQIRDFAAYANQRGLTFRLVLRQSTEISRPLAQFIKQNDISVRYIP